MAKLRIVSRHDATPGRPDYREAHNQLGKCEVSDAESKRYLVCYHDEIPTTQIIAALWHDRTVVRWKWMDKSVHPHYQQKNFLLG